MSSHTSFQIFLQNEKATALLGSLLAEHLNSGDQLLLKGSIGAGKTHLARALIQARLGRREDVPSPTFTLVQTYEAADCEVWHADLYRLSHPDEIIELGLENAFESAICLIEWPDRLGDLAPDSAITLSLTSMNEGRMASFSGGRAGQLETILAKWVKHAQ